MIPIRDDFQDYIAPAWFEPTVQRLLASLSTGHVHGLSAIVLTNATRATRRKGARSARRNRRGTPIGRYHPAWAGEMAWVELIVDRIVEEIPKPLDRLQFARDAAVARVLYHEIGHHLHNATGSAERGGEPSAEGWRKRLSWLHFRKRYWYLRPVAALIRTLVRAVRRFDQ